jgi:hypothetical protein
MLTELFGKFLDYCFKQITATKLGGILIAVMFMYLGTLAAQLIKLHLQKESGPSVEKIEEGPDGSGVFKIDAN